MKTLDHGPKPQSRTSASAGPGVQCVLVVDDQPQLRAILVRYLARMGFRVEEAPDVETAARRLGGSGFHRVLLDVNLPGGGGMKVLRFVEDRRVAMRDRIVFMTGGFLCSGEEQVVHSTGLPLLWKPFELEELEGVLRS